MSLPSPEQLESVGYLRLPSPDSASAADTITEAELAAYYQRHDSSSLAAEAAAGMAARIFADIEASREPEYEPGAMYEDAAGCFWLYQPFRAADPGSWAECPWLKPGSTGPFNSGTPERPLYRLVREGSPLAGSERDLIRADLGRLLDLLGMGDFARPESPHEVFLACLDEVARLVDDREPAPLDPGKVADLIIEATRDVEFFRDDAIDLARRICKMAGGEA